MTRYGNAAHFITQMRGYTFTEDEAREVKENIDRQTHAGMTPANPTYCPQDASEELGNAEGSPYEQKSQQDPTEAKEHWAEYQAEQKYSEGE